MSAVMVTGISGAGKSSRRRARGLASIDADNDPSLARFMDRTGAVVAFPAAPDFAWLSRHSWEWKPGSTGRTNPGRSASDRFTRSDPRQCRHGSSQ